MASAGREPFSTQLDLHTDYAHSLTEKLRLKVAFDTFNVANSKGRAKQESGYRYRVLDWRRSHIPDTNQGSTALLWPRIHSSWSSRFGVLALLQRGGDLRSPPSFWFRVASRNLGHTPSITLEGCLCGAGAGYPDLIARQSFLVEASSFRSELSGRVGFDARAFPRRYGS